MGQLEILNVSGGDITITFDKESAAETIRAKRMIVDMLHRGYALLVKIDGAYSRVMDFDETHGEYIIADFDPVQRGARAVDVETPELQPIIKDEYAGKQKEEIKGKGRKVARKRLPMEKSSVVAVARSAGG